MKHKRKLLDIGGSTYFHHRHGVVFRKKRSRVSALFASTLFVVGGGFFITSHLAIPAIKHLRALQNQHPVSVNSTVFAESDPDAERLVNRENAVLKELINEKLASFPKDQKWSVFMYDLNGNGMFSINADRVLPSASLYKLFLLEALESKVPFDRWVYTWLPDGTNLQDCVQDMLKVSDSACGENIGSYVGWSIVDKLNQKNGFNHTKISGIEGRETTAGDTGEFLIRLKKGQILSDKARRFVFDVLYQQISKKGISGGCINCRVADKIGEMSGVAHDAGIVTHGSHSYVLVIMSEGGNLKQVADITKTIETQ